MISVRIEANGIPQYATYLKALPSVTKRAASIAINEITEGYAVREARKKTYAEVAFPRGYLDGERLDVTQRAFPERLEAQITGRFRPTSLARFALPGQSQEATRRTGIRVRVNPGRSELITPPSFFLKLNAGPNNTDNFNLGIAIRLKPGETVRNRRFPDRYRLGNDDVFILYGPSVEQVFREVAADIAPDVVQRVGQEFVRQFERLAENAR